MDDQDAAELKMLHAKLQQEHSDFSAPIDAMVICNCNSLQIQRMKKKKLAIKDRLQKLEDEIIPDIIA